MADLAYATTRGRRSVARVPVTKRLASVLASVVLVGVLVPAGAVAADTVTTKLVGEGGPPSISPPHWVSDDGRYVLFNGATGFILADTVADTTTPVTGAGYNYGSLSDNGRYVSYLGFNGVSTAAALWDRTTGTSEFVSLTNDGQPASAEYYGSTVSGDGRYVAFSSRDPALQPAGWDYDTMGNGLFLRDRVAETTSPITSTPGGHASGSYSGPSLSDDGGVAVWGGSLLPSGSGQIVVWTRATNSLSELAVGCCSDVGPMVSGNGRYVVWSGSDELGVDAGVWLHDLQTGTTQNVVIGNAQGASISDDGRYISYALSNADFTATDVYRRDRQTGTVIQVNFNPTGTRVNSGGPTGLSGDGTKVAFVAIYEAAPAETLLASITTTGSLILPTLDPPLPLKDATWAWGDNTNGVLGIGDNAARTLPTEVSSLPDTTKLAAGQGHSLAIRSDGTVWAWGDGSFGQLGNGFYETRTTPDRVTGLTNVVAISAGGSHSLALRSNGTVWAWGSNDYGQLGDGTVTRRATPIQVGLTNVTAIAACGYHSLALRSNGTVWAWGDNFYGTLGDGTTTVRRTPVAVVGLTGVQTAVACGFFHSLALRADGTVRSWGLNGDGQLGDGSTVQRNTPVLVSGLGPVKAVAGGFYHSLAARTDGAVWGWGNNALGQLGDGTLTGRRSPVAVLNVAAAQSIAAGGYHSLALLSDRTVRAWGSGYSGALGDGALQVRATPVAVAGLTQTLAIAAGGAHSLAVGRASPNQGVESFTTNVPAGSAVTTDVESDGATALDPLETTVRTPVTGSISIVEGPSVSGWFGDFAVAGRVVEITAPVASVPAPLLLGFRMDVSIFPTTWGLSVAVVYRNHALVGDCSGPGAMPNPCVESRTRLPDGDVEIVVRTSIASEWLIGRAGPTAEAAGPYSVVEGSDIVLHGGATGGEAPYRFQWRGATDELANAASATPIFSGRDDGQFHLALEVTDAAGLVGVDDTTVTVTNALPSIGAIVPNAKKLKANTQIKVTAPFTDPGTRDAHTASWSWGDGKSSTADVAESAGTGVVGGNHVYQKAGNYTITLTVRDDDGGTQNRAVVLTVSP